MNSTRITGGSGTRRRRRVAVAALAIVAAIAGIGALTGFHLELREIDPPGPNGLSEVVGSEVVGIRTFTSPEGIRVEADLEYGTREDGTLLTLDVCRPAATDRVRRGGRSRYSPPRGPLDPRRQLGPRRQGEHRLAQRVHVARERGLRRGIRQLPARAERALPVGDRRRRPRRRVAPRTRAGRPVRHRPRTHRRVRGIGRAATSPRCSARAAMVRSMRDRGLRPSPNSRARSGSAPPNWRPTGHPTGFAASSATTWAANRARATRTVRRRRMPRRRRTPTRATRPSSSDMPSPKSCRSGSRSGSRRASRPLACRSSSRSCRAASTRSVSSTMTLRPRVAAFLHAHLG